MNEEKQRNTETLIYIQVKRVYKENVKKELNISCKKTECMIVSERTSSKCELNIGDNNIKQVPKCKYLVSDLTED